MRNPKKARDILGVLCVISAISGGVMIAKERAGAELGNWYFVMFMFLNIVLIGGPCAIYLHWVHRRRQRILRGEGVLARWIIPPEEWERFLANDLKRAAEYPVNRLKVKPERVASGVEAIIAKDGMMVDGDYNSFTDLRKLRWIEEAPHSIEFYMVTSGKSGSTHWIIRFPVINDAIKDAWEAYQQIRTKRGLNQTA